MKELGLLLFVKNAHCDVRFENLEAPLNATSDVGIGVERPLEIFYATLASELSFLYRSKCRPFHVPTILSRNTKFKWGRYIMTAFSSSYHKALCQDALSPEYLRSPLSGCFCSRRQPGRSWAYCVVHAREQGIWSLLCKSIMSFRYTHPIILIPGYHGWSSRFQGPKVSLLAY